MHCQLKKEKRKRHTEAHNIICQRSYSHSYTPYAVMHYQPRIVMMR